MHVCKSCNCNHKSHKINIDVPIEPSKVKDKKFNTKTEFQGDFY